MLITLKEHIYFALIDLSDTFIGHLLLHRNNRNSCGAILV